MKSLFLRSYGDSPLLRVLDFLLVHQEYDYSMKDIARNARIGYTTLKLLWPSLVSRKIVAETRKVGKAKMYRLNTTHPEVKLFSQLYWTVVKRTAGSVRVSKAL